MNSPSPHNSYIRNEDVFPASSLGPCATCRAKTIYVGANRDTVLSADLHGRCELSSLAIAGKGNHLGISEVGAYSIISYILPA